MKDRLTFAAVQQYNNMGAVRLKCEFTSRSFTPANGRSYILEIHDMDIDVDADIDFNMRLTGPVHEYDQDDKDIFQPIRTSVLSFNIILENGNTDHDDFLTDYINSKEGRFLVKLYKEHPTFDEVLFIGRLNHDITTIRQEQNNVLELSAVDPFTELSHIDYTATTYLIYSYKTILITQILYLSKTVQYFYPNTTDEILRIYNHWKDDLHADTTDILSKTYIQNYFTKADNGQVRKNKLTYVLSELMKSLAARIYFEDGVFVIEQIALRVESDEEYSSYLVDLTFDSTNLTTQYTADFETNNDNADVLPDITFKSPLNAVKLSQNGNYVSNLLFEYKFAYNITPSGPHLISEVVQLSDQKVYSRLVINPYMVTNVAYDPSYYKYLYFVFDVTIRVGTKYLSGDAGIEQSYNQVATMNVSDCTWSSSASSRVRLYCPAYIYYTDIQNNANDKFYTFDIISPDIEEIGNVYFEFEYIETYEDFALTILKNASKLPVFNLSFWFVNTNSIAILADISDGDEDLGTTVKTLVNESDNTKIYDVSYDMGSFTGELSRHRLRVNNINTDSEEWVHPTYGNLPYEEMAMYEIRSVYAKATKQFRANMRYSKSAAYIPKMRNRLIYDGDTYIPMTFSHNLVANTAKTIWFQIAAFAAVPSSPPVVAIPYEPIIKSGLIGNPAPPQNNLVGNENSSTNTLDLFYEEGTMAGSTYDLSTYDNFPDVDDVTMASINHSIKISIGSTLYHIKDLVVGSLANTECRLDFATKEIQFNRDLTGRLIRIDCRNLFIIKQPTV